jgi:hypothetical protein
MLSYSSIILVLRPDVWKKRIQRRVYMSSSSLGSVACNGKCWLPYCR